MFLIFSGAGLQAQWRAPKYSNEFLAIGVGAGGLALAGAQAPVATGIQAAYWNPAGLAFLEKRAEGSLMHASYFGGIANYDYAGLAIRTDSQSVLGISYIRFGVDDIPDTRFLIENGQVDYRRIRTFSSVDNAYLLSYARKNAGLPGLTLGGSFKLIYRRAGRFANAWGFGLDAGARYRLRKWNLGLVLRDVTTTFNAWSFNTTEFEQVFAQTGNAIPVNSTELTLPSLTLGISRSWSFLKDKVAVQPVLDVVNTFDGKRNTLLSSGVVSCDPRLGMEIRAFRVFAVRSGLGNWQRVRNFDGGLDWRYRFTFGAGIRWKTFAIDYAITDLGGQSEALYSHIFSLNAHF